MTNNMENKLDKVIIITPTYNRKNFLPTLIYQFYYQDYNKDYLSMIILDDSNVSNQGFFDSLRSDIKSRITYIYDSNKKTIGAKRNLLNNMAVANGADYIVCFDDDDYYPPYRVSYGVSKLKESNYLIGGSSGLLIYYPEYEKIYLLGPFINKVYTGHALNGTLIYNKKYLDDNSYDDSDTQTEEKKFLKNFKATVFQFDYDKVMICMSHNSNTINKKNILASAKETKFKLEDFIKDNLLLEFFRHLEI